MNASVFEVTKMAHTKRDLHKTVSNRSIRRPSNRIADGLIVFISTVKENIEGNKCKWTS